MHKKLVVMHLIDLFDCLFDVWREVVEVTEEQKARFHEHEFDSLAKNRVM